MTTSEAKTLTYRLSRIALITGGILLLIALTAAPWTLLDFVAMGTLLFIIGAAYELITTKVESRFKIAVAVGLALVFFLLWAELSVGIFGTPFAGS